MAGIAGYMQLLRECGHKTKLITIYGHWLKNQRLEAAKYIFEQKNQGKYIR